MTASELNQLTELMTAGSPSFEDDTETLRNDFNGVLESLPLDESLKFEERSIGGINGTWLSGPSNSQSILLYLHGGAYVAGTAYGYRSLSSSIAQAVGSAHFSVEYRLAPETPFPGALDDALDAYRGLLDDGYTADRIVVAGDSAGGGLAAALLIALKNAGLQQPAGAWLISPWADLGLTGDSIRTKADVDLLLTPAGLRKTSREYLNGEDASNPLASPIHADWSSIAPLKISAGGAEILMDDAIQLSARAAHAGVSVQLDIVSGLLHDYPLFAPMLSEGRDAIAAGAAFLADCLVAAQETTTEA